MAAPLESRRVTSLFPDPAGVPIPMQGMGDIPQQFGGYCSL